MPLGAVVENLDGRRIPVKEADRRLGPYPYYGASGIVDYVDGYLFDGEHLLIAEDGENLRTRNTPIAFIATGRFWVNNHAHVVRGNALANTRFLLYALQGADISGYLTGTTIPKLTQRALHEIPILLPPPHEQERIMGVLGALDDKIDLNRRTNETLEAMARAVFKSWFVDFEHAPLTEPSQQQPAVPSRRVESPIGPIPAGWTTTAIGDWVELVRGTTYQSALLDEPGPSLLGLGSIQRNGGFRSGALRTYGGESPARLLLRPGDLYVSLKDVTQSADLLGAVARVPRSIPSGRLTQDTVKLALRAGLTEHHADYLYWVLRAPNYREYCRSRAIGTTNLSLSREDFLGYAFATPPPPILAQLMPILRSMTERVEDDRETLRLTEIRDQLLPRLVSGELAAAG